MSSTLDNVSLANSYATIDGLVVVNANELFVNGQAVTGDVGVYLPLAGGTMTGNIQMNTNYIQSSHVPSTVSELTNKAYVDAAVSGLSSTYVPYTSSVASLDMGTNSVTAQNVIVGNSTTAGTLSFGAPSGYLPWKISTDSSGKLKFRTASGATPILFSIDSAGNIITAGTVTASTAQFTGITSATPALALGVDSSGNLNTFSVPTSVNLLPLNNTWTGTNQFNQPVYFPGSSTFVNSIISGSATLAQNNSTNVNRVQFTGSGGVYNEYIFSHTGTSLNYDAQISVSNTTANPSTNNTGQMSIYAGSVALPQTTIGGGVAPPSTGTSGGTGDRIILYPGTSSAYPYSLGINGGTLWYSAPTGATHNWYIGGNSCMALVSTGVSFTTQNAAYTNNTIAKWRSNNTTSEFNFYQQVAAGAYNSICQNGDFLMCNMDNQNGVSSTAGIVIANWNQTAGIRIGQTTIQLNGNVGIGMIPSYILDVNGNFRAGFNTAGYVTIQGASNPYCGYTEYKNGSTRYGYIGYGTVISGETCLDFHSENGWGMDFVTSSHNIYFYTDGGTTPKVQIGTVGVLFNGYTTTSVNYGNGGTLAIWTNPNTSSTSYALLGLNCGQTSGNFSIFMNSPNRQVDGTYNMVTLRNDSGSVRLMAYGNYLGFCANQGEGSAGFSTPNYTNVILNTISPSSGNVASWNSYNGGFTLFCNNPLPTNYQAALGIGVYNNGSSSATYIVSLSPGIAWLPCTIYNSYTAFTANGAVCGYTVPSGGSNVSDAREKHSINDYPSHKSLAKILKLKPKTYKRIHYDKNAKGEDLTPAPQSQKDFIHIGLLAQEVLDVNPACVSTWINDAIKSDTETGERYGICYDDFIVHLIGAVQEQQKTITSLTGTVSSLTTDCSVITSQASTITSQATQIQSLTETVSSLTSQVQSLTGTVTSLIASITAMKSTLSTALRITL